MLMVHRQRFTDMLQSLPLLAHSAVGIDKSELVQSQSSSLVERLLPTGTGRRHGEGMFARLIRAIREEDG